MEAVAITLWRRAPRVKSIRVARVFGARRSADDRLVQALQQGDERAFTELVKCHHSALVRTARVYVRDPAIAEELAQETWLIVLRSLDSFRGGSELKTWIFTILINRAKSRGEREQRQVPISALAMDDEPAVSEDRFLPRSDPAYPRLWSSPPQPWPEERLLVRETLGQIRAAVQELPAAQQIVLGLRDVEGWTSKEVCAALEISPGNERVLLHRARARVRASLESYLEQP